MAAAGSLLKLVCEEATCSVCLKYFTDPVITDCGHNFCRACLTQCWGEPGKNAPCPQCRGPVQQSSLRPNKKLANIAEIAKKFRLRVAKGAEGAGGGVCERHQEPLKLFCRDDDAPICVVCDRSKEHKGHRVIPVEEAAEEYKGKIQIQLHSLEEGREKFVQHKVAEEQKSQECLKQLEEEKQEIMSDFKEMHKFLEKQERVWLMELADLEKEIKEKQEESITRLSKEISHFSDLIVDLELRCHQPPSEFLQDIRGTLNRCLAVQVRQPLELSSGLEWRLQSHSPKPSVLKKAMEEFEGSLKQELSKESLKQALSKESLKQAPSKVSVTLDSKTAHPNLVLSEDLKSVFFRSSKQYLPDNAERFDSMPCVLGRERFTSGRHCWEVRVEELGAVGVARDSVRRKQWAGFSPHTGFWAVGREKYRSHVVLAYTSPELTFLALSRDLKKIRVLLDYEEGRVEFFNADTDHLIFAFPPASFSGEVIRPIFEVQSVLSLKC